LYVSNDFGTDSAVKTNYLDILPAKPPVPQNLTYLDTACLALATLSVDTVPGIATLIWQLPATASLISSTQYTKRISWTAAGGPYRFWVKSVNACGSSDSVTGDVVVLKNPTFFFKTYFSQCFTKHYQRSKRASIYILIYVLICLIF